MTAAWLRTHRLALYTIHSRPPTPHRQLYEEGTCERTCANSPGQKKKAKWHFPSFCLFLLHYKLITSEIIIRCQSCVYQSKTTWIHYFGTYVPHSSIVVSPAGLVLSPNWHDRIPLFDEKNSLWSFQRRRRLVTSWFSMSKRGSFTYFPYSASKWYVRSTPYKILRCGAQKSGTYKNRRSLFFVVRIPPWPRWYYQYFLLHKSFNQFKLIFARLIIRWRTLQLSFF